MMKSVQRLVFDNSFDNLLHKPMSHSSMYCSNMYRSNNCHSNMHRSNMFNSSTAFKPKPRFKFKLQTASLSFLFSRFLFTQFLSSQYSVLRLFVLAFMLFGFSSAQAENQQKSETILVLGDSLSAAYKLSAKKGWVYLLQQKLMQEDLAYEVVNASVSGATTAAGLQLLPQALEKHEPKLVILELGANDGLQGKPVSYITENLRQLIRVSQQSGAQVILVGIRVPPNFGKRYTEPFFEQYARLAEEENIALVPFLMDGVAGRDELMMGDGLHPKPAGQSIMLDNVWQTLSPLLKK